MTVDLSNTHLLICDDEKNMRYLLSDIMTEEGYQVDAAANGKEVLEYISAQQEGYYSVLILDLAMPEMDGFEVLKELKKLQSNISVIVITAFGTLDAAVTTMQFGAKDFVVKPFGVDQIKAAVRRALESRDLLNQISYSQPHIISTEDQEIHIVGSDDRLKSIFDLIARVSDLDTSVLIQGESGTGKELVAQAIHYNGIRKDQPFVAVNCGALPEALLESEFFGHERGAFTGAHAMQKGKFEIADGGTLFLDEIGEMPLSLQVKFLRVLQERKFQRVGGEKEQKCDVRIIAATNRNLVDAVKQKTFREDLYYRLNVLPIRIPSLRERKSDIPELVIYFMNRFQEKHKLPPLDISSHIMNLIQERQWKGNIRELQNSVEKAMILGDPKYLTAEMDQPIGGSPDLDSGDEIPKGSFDSIESFDHLEEGEIPSDDCVVHLGEQGTIRNLGIVAAEAQRHAIIRAISISGGNKAEAAKALGVSRKTLFNKINELGIRSSKSDEEDEV